MSYIRTSDLRGENIIDPRDFRRRLEELESDFESDWEDNEFSDWDELKAMRDIADEVPADETLINDAYFETYARELAEDIGALQNCDHWPAACIDWEQAAKELQVDYSSLEFDGTTYWFRSC